VVGVGSEPDTDIHRVLIELDMEPPNVEIGFLMKSMHAHYLLTAVALLVPVVIFAQQQIGDASGIFTSSTEIGTTRKGSTVFVPASGEYRVTGGGADIWGTADDFHFTWVRLSGDVSLTADIRFPASSPEVLRKALLMIRQSLDPGSAYADAAIHGDGHINLQFRVVDGGKTDDTLSTQHGSTRLRIERKGSQFTIFAGEPGQALIPAPPMTIVMRDPLYVGIGVCAHNANAVEEAIFSNVKIEQPSQQGDKK
jgi:TolB protein